MDLFGAVGSGNLAQVEACLRDSAARLDALKDGKTALHLAIEKKFHLPTKMLIEAGAGLDVQDANGRTSLFMAVICQDSQAVGMLLAAGANPDIQDSSGNTVLYKAADFRNEDILKQLLEADANLDIQNTAGWTALHMAAYRGCLPAIKGLIESGANPNIRNISGNTPSQIDTSSEIRHLLTEYMKSYQPRERVEVRRERPAHKGKTPTTTADNLARLDRILTKKKAGGNAVEASAGETWLYLPPLHILRVKELVAADLRLKDVFDFESRRQTTVTEQLATGAMSAETQEFDNIKDKTLLEKALFRFNEAGGNADPEVIQTGHRTRNKGNLDELRKKGI